MDDKTRGIRPEADEFAGRSEESLRGYATDAGVTDTTAPDITGGPTRRKTTTATASRKTAGAAAGATTDPDTERRTREIEAEIQQTREDMSETIDAIQERLKPSNIVAEATDRVKTATTEKVRDMADSASDTAQGMVESVRQNPIPAVMIGAGVAWMLMGRSRSGAYKSSSSWRQRDWSEASYGATETPRSGGSAAGSYGASETPRYGGYQAEGGYYAGSSDRGGSSIDVSRIQGRLQRWLRENPLLVGAAAVVVGAAVGAALPETDRENQLLGETRDNVVERAQDMARNVKNTVKDVAGDAVTKVADEVGKTS